MNKKTLIEACLSDYCFCSHENRKKCACDGLTVFAKECQFQGVSLNNEWRDMQLCRKFHFLPSKIYQFKKKKMNKIVLCVQN